MKDKLLLEALVATAFAASSSLPAQAACSPTPFAAGLAATVTVNGIPRSSGFAGRIVDSNGVGLAACLTGTGVPDGTAANPCTFDPVETGNDFSAALGRGLEAFWFLADNVFATSGPAAIIGRVVTGVESTFLPAAVADGNQFPFQRLRIRMDVNAVGRYTVEHPWGSKTYEVTALEPGSGLSKGEIDDTLDVPFAPGQLVAGVVTPFLKWDPAILPAAPPGYLGDGFTPHAVVGSPCSADFVRVTAVGLDGMTPVAIDPSDVDGDGMTHVFTSRLFTVMGQLAPSAPGSTRLANLSTRMRVGTADDVLIGGFIIGGTQAKTVVVRARGPSLVPFGIANALANPTMQLVSGQSVLAASDDWGSAANAAAIAGSGFAPSNALESAILATLSPGPYTAVVSGVSGTTGVGIVEVFEVDRPEAPLANISTRGQVLTEGDVMIGGFVIQGDAPQTVVVRARGPSLVPFGIANALQDPVLQLFSGATPIAVNDNWLAAANAASIQASGFAPSNANESAILITLPPGAYTAIVTGAGGTTGVGIVEVFSRF
ncbi:MAG: hypothetical protein IPJ28_15205 [Betaproteobacteria bacterium]|nr:hypothetical protein [Betaproteobacteria bacterium]